MRFSSRLPTIAALMLAFATLACRVEIPPADAAGTATEANPGSSEAASDAASADEPREPVAERLGRASGEAADATPTNASFGSLDLLAPALPGFSLGTFSATCDPFDDSFDTCL